MDLFDTVHRRHPVAAPGLDGWRTSDVQALPVQAFVPIAEFLNELEHCNEDIPKVLTKAKQMVLNKNGSAEPMQKRLIAILPVFLLTYTGTRYFQLKKWQQIAMPIYTVVWGHPRQTDERNKQHLAFAYRHCPRD